MITGVNILSSDELSSVFEVIDGRQNSLSYEFQEATV